MIKLKLTFSRDKEVIEEEFFTPRELHRRAAILSLEGLECKSYEDGKGVPLLLETIVDNKYVVLTSQARNFYTSTIGVPLPNDSHAKELDYNPYTSTSILIVSHYYRNETKEAAIATHSDMINNIEKYKD